MRQLFCADNLDVLRRHLRDKSIDLVYVDPPLHPNAHIKSSSPLADGCAEPEPIQGHQSVWPLGPDAERAFDEVTNAGDTRIKKLLHTMLDLLGHGDAMDYLAAMAVRLVEVHRVLGETGSVYVHCDPSASHHLRLLLDGVFGADCFRSEIIWKRANAYNGTRAWGPIHDVILFYSKSSNFTWNRADAAHDDAYLERYYSHHDQTGHRYRPIDLTASGIRGGESGQVWNDLDPTAHGRHWVIPATVKSAFPDIPSDTKTLTWLDLLIREDLILMPDGSRRWPQFKRYFHEMEGQSPQDIVDDIPALGKRHGEMLGYPTQKPQALLERLISASTNPGDTVLDPFCGSGTALHAAQKLGRRWIGIDSWERAIALAERRLKDAFPDIEMEVVS